MRLKRSDLVRDFEQIVQQEIKNHNDTILATNMALEKIRDSVADLSHNLAKTHAICQNQYNDLCSTFNVLESKFNHLSHHTQRQLDNFCDEIQQQRVDFDRKNDHIEQNTVDLDTYNEAVREIKDTLIELAKDIVKQKSFVQGCIGDLYQEVRRWLEEFREEVWNRPNHLWDVKKELEKKIEESRVDSAGVLRELQIYKKGAFIMEKKIENLYSLIEKLEKGLRK